MSNHHKQRLSLKGGPNVPTTEPTAQPPVEMKKPMQENKMEANPNQAAPSAEKTGPTDKERAALEEQQSASAHAAAKAADEHSEEPLKIVNLAGKGYDELHDAMRKAAEANRKKEYVPPPMTERQLSLREEELEAGRRAVARAKEQQANRPAPKADLKEGFTTPVHRPGNVVPDPILRAGPSAAGTKGFSPDV